MTSLTIQWYNYSLSPQLIASKDFTVKSVPIKILLPRST